MNVSQKDWKPHKKVVAGTVANVVAHALAAAGAVIGHDVDPAVLAPFALSLVGAPLAAYLKREGFVKAACDHHEGEDR